tara:strand:- start:1074 stop:1400 length:327 start_codon:yes stop_codon:yes gene_type:complete
MAKQKLEDVIEPLGARIIVIRDQAEDETLGGIIIPAQAQEEPSLGTVVRAGEGCIAEWSAGDRVLIPKFAGKEITVADWTVVVMEEDEIFLRLHLEDKDKKKAAEAGR